MRSLLLTILLLLCLPSVAAIEGSIKLLAVGGEDNAGNVADLALEIREGRGRVFLETFPLTKVDTQISMRFAQQIACNALDKDCSDLDFIYTIRATASIIGGPSAGASAAVLTYLLLEKKDFDKNIAVTGTINSGGLIGAVGGIQAKIEAAHNVNLTTVLIPKGKRYVEEDNETRVDLVLYGEELGITVKEVSILGEVLAYYTNTPYVKEEVQLQIPTDYKDNMKYIAFDLCARNDQFEYPEEEIDDFLKELLNNSKNYRETSKLLLEENQFYSGASYCFRANINNGYATLYLQDLTPEEVKEKLQKIEEGAKEFNKRLEKKQLQTIPDLQTYMIVKQRILETLEHVDAGFKEINTTEVAYTISLANERLYSALAWSNFFKSKGKPFALDLDALKNSCETKIREAEERLQYVLLFIPNALENVREEIEQAHDDLDSGDYELCLFKASKAKAEANVIISSIGTDKELLDEILAEKLAVAQQTIAKSASKGMFPIVGYSYYEYAKNLKDKDTNLALLFAEYALELSNINIYFKEPVAGIQIEKTGVLFFIILVALGILAIVLKPKEKKPKKR